MRLPYQYAAEIHFKARAASVEEAMLKASDAVLPAIKEALAAGAPGLAVSRSAMPPYRRMYGYGHLSGEEGWYDLHLDALFDSDEREWGKASAWLRAILEAVCDPDLRFVSLCEGKSPEWCA